MSYTPSLPSSNYPYLANSKSFQGLERPLRQRKVSQFSSKNSYLDYLKTDEQSSDFLRSTMGSLASRPNKELFQSAAIESDRKQPVNLRHTTGNLADILKSIKFDSQSQQQPSVGGKKYAGLTATQYSFSPISNVPPTSNVTLTNGFKKEKSNLTNVYESKPATNYEYPETRKDRTSKMNIDDILNKLKRQKQLQQEIKKLKQEKKLRQQKQNKQKASKLTSPSNSQSKPTTPSSFTSPYKEKQVYNKNPEDAINSQRKIYTNFTGTGFKPADYDKYDFKKSKNEQCTYTPKRDYETDKIFENAPKKYETTVKKQYDWKKSLQFKKQTPETSYTFTKDFSKTAHETQKTYSYLKSPTASKPKQDAFSKYFSSSSSQKGQKFDCKVSIYDFKLGKTLGQGKFGTVYQALHKQTFSLYALKKVPKSIVKSHYMIDQFILELKIQTFMFNEQILALHGFFHDAENIYLILDYMEEGTLYSVLKKKKKLEYEDAARKIQEIAKGIIYMHNNGIAHRDIKPENVVMSYGSCKLCDFGWSTICDERRKTYCGTFDYAAPEILQGTEYDMSVDLWCLGVLAYELLVGKAPFYHIKKEETKKKILNVILLE